MNMNENAFLVIVSCIPSKFINIWRAVTNISSERNSEGYSFIYVEYYFLVNRGCFRPILKQLEVDISRY